MVNFSLYGGRRPNLMLFRITVKAIRNYGGGKTLINDDVLLFENKIRVVRILTRPSPGLMFGK